MEFTTKLLSKLKTKSLITPIIVVAEESQFKLLNKLEISNK